MVKSIVALVRAIPTVLWVLIFAVSAGLGSAAAGAGGIGFNLFLAGSFYFDLHEMGFLTYVVVIAVVLLEMISTKIVTIQSW